MSSSGDFYLTGQGGGLTWTQVSSSLIIQGRISGSQIQGGTIVGSSLSRWTDRCTKYKTHLYLMLIVDII